jgi:hypothetical protein
MQEEQNIAVSWKRRKKLGKDRLLLYNAISGGIGS